MHFGETYYVFGRTAGNEVAFNSDSDYSIFLSKYGEVIQPIASTFAYCLLPDQYHFLVRISKKDRIPVSLDTSQEKTFISKQFGRLMNSFTLEINNQRNRRGNLFIRPFRRDPFENDEVLVNSIRMIHLLPVESGLCDHPGKWLHSSYFPITNLQSSLVDWTELEYLFNDVETFENFHFEKEIIELNLPSKSFFKAA